MIKRGQGKSDSRSYFDNSFGLPPKSKRSDSRSYFDNSFGLPPKSKRSDSRSYFENSFGLPPKSKRSQITVFVIIALVIVASIILLFVSIPSQQARISPARDPQGYIQACAKIALTVAELKVIATGGFTNPPDYLLFNNTKLTWMCYTPFNEQLCTNKHPMLNKEIETEIKKEILPKISKCFEDVEKALANSEYTQQETSLDVAVSEKYLSARISKPISYVKNNQKLEITNFDVSLFSPLFRFIMFENDIINQELNCNCGKETCNADILELNKRNRDFEVRRFVTGKNEKVYSIKEVLTEKQFNFAVRNCVRLP
jgi:hypothetical protein